MAGKPGRKLGRPFLYTPEIAQEILDRIADGESLVSICEADHMPAPRTVVSWAMGQHLPSELDKSFVTLYARAREMQREVWAEEAMDVARRVQLGKKKIKKSGTDGRGEYEEEQEIEYDAIDRSKLRVETLKWFLGRLDRGKYGDRVQIDGNAAIEIVTKGGLPEKEK